MAAGRGEAEATRRRFELGWRDRRIGPMQTPRRFLDYIIDGGPALEREGHDLDLISSLGWSVPDEDEDAAQRLLLNAAPDVEGRVSIYVCPECGDLYCGALTAIIEQQGDEIVWRDIAHTTFDWDADADRWDHALLPQFNEFRFDAGDYSAAIRKRPRP